MPSVLTAEVWEVMYVHWPVEAFHEVYVFQITGMCPVSIDNVTE